MLFNGRRIAKLKNKNCIHFGINLTKIEIIENNAAPITNSRLLFGFTVKDIQSK